MVQSAAVHDCRSGSPFLPGLPLRRCYNCKDSVCDAYHYYQLAQLHGGYSRRRDCHLMAPPSTFSRVSIQTDRGFIKMTVSPTARLQLGAGAGALDCPLPEVRRNCRRRLRRPALHRRAPRPPGRPTDRPSWPGPSRLAGGHPQCVPDKVHSSELPRRLCPPAAAVPLRGPRSARGCQGRYSRGRLAPTGGGGAADARAAATTRGRGGLHG